MKIVVLGAGLVGSAIVRDLAAEPDFDVTAVDIDRTLLAGLAAEIGVGTTRADLREPEAVSRVVSGADLVISAVPGCMGFATLKAIISAGKNVVDISFFAEDPFLLDDLARRKGVTAVVDCGVAPGLCNIIAGRVQAEVDQIDRYTCYVGGLPAIRRWPYEYQAGFSPSDVLEEYIRPARMVENGQEVVYPALSAVELIDFPLVGTLEAFNTDGLRTLRRTLKAANMREKTLRYPGHANLMRIFRESGFFSEEPVVVDEQPVRPIALASKLLFEQWRLGEGEHDFTVMQVLIEGWDRGHPFLRRFDLFDRYDVASHTTSMARTTGYTCAIVARQVLDGLFDEKGVCPPEYLGRTPGCYEDLLAGYARRGIHVVEQAF